MRTAAAGERSPYRTRAPAAAGAHRGPHAFACWGPLPQEVLSRFLRVAVGTHAPWPRDIVTLPVRHVEHLRAAVRASAGQLSAPRGAVWLLPGVTHRYSPARRGAVEQQKAAGGRGGGLLPHVMSASTPESAPPHYAVPRCAASRRARRARPLLRTPTDAVCSRAPALRSGSVDGHGCASRLRRPRARARQRNARPPVAATAERCARARRRTSEVTRCCPARAELHWDGSAWAAPGASSTGCFSRLLCCAYPRPARLPAPPTPAGQLRKCVARNCRARAQGLDLADARRLRRHGQRSGLRRADGHVERVGRQPGQLAARSRQRNELHVLVDWRSLHHHHGWYSGVSHVRAQHSFAAARLHCPT